MPRSSGDYGRHCTGYAAAPCHDPGTSDEPRSLHAELAALRGRAGPMHLTTRASLGCMRPRERGVQCFGRARLLTGATADPPGVERAGPQARCPEGLDIPLGPGSEPRPQYASRNIHDLGDAGRLPAVVRARIDPGGHAGYDGLVVNEDVQSCTTTLVPEHRSCPNASTVAFCRGGRYRPSAREPGGRRASRRAAKRAEASAGREQRPHPGPA